MPVEKSNAPQLALRGILILEFGKKRGFKEDSL